ncbi:MAG: hypothetical protein ACRYFX_00915 [Janthinobacterium lividum]
MLATTNGPQFRYTLSSDLLGTKRLRYEPTGWEDGIGVNLHRDTKTHGVATEFSSQLGYVKDGKAYLLRAYQAAGVEADVRQLIEQYDPNAFVWQPYSQGRVNFTAAEFTAQQAKVNVEQQGWLQKFLSRDSVGVDLLGATSVSGSTGPAATPQVVQLHSRAVFQRYAASQKQAVTTSGQMFGGDSDPSHEQVLYFGFDTPEVNQLGLGAVAGGWVASDAYTAVSIFTAPADGQYVVDLALFADIEASVPSGSFVRKFHQVEALCHFRVNGDPSTATKLQADISQHVNGHYQGSIVVPPRTFPLTLAKGDNLYLYADYYLHELDGTSLDQYQATISATLKPGSYLRIESTTTTAATPTTGLLLYEAFERLTQALTDEVDVFRSDFFGRTDLGYAVDGPGALTLLTGGFQVRGFPLLADPAPAAGAPDPRKSLTSSWQELFDSCAAVWGLGCGLEWALGKNGRPVQVLRVEPLAYWYPADVVVDLTDAGPVTDALKVDAAAHYQVVELGYDKWQAQQANGLDEYNAGRQWTTPLTVVKNTYSAKSKLSASGILLETTRRDRYDATATQDTGQDATGFLVCLLRTATGFETERNQKALLLTGVLSPNTVYNLRLSPARMLRHHGAALRAGLLATPSAQVRFTSGEGNVTMRSQLTGETATLAENDDVAVADLAAPLWRAEQVTFRAPVRRAQLQALLARPTGRVRYLNSQAQACEGWVLDFKHEAKDEQADFTLLPCA